ncbi:BRCA1 C-terminal domain protein [Ligilactobacillus salivarius DSM 20555 = ATCC 11741]|uniref:BRCA1 C-terminal domain protein n=3 Tax=Ligilactobacillus salivarius TaxID=1624 RepID=C2EIR1_9LACO|nr:BRCA1 C-terminal domain protein [Ligilactobacillus salivarius DSM 20555 = ATCC 11741]
MVFKNKMTFKNKCVVFTGSLQSMLRKDAIEKINAAGGIVKNYVSKETDYLVIAPRQLDMFEEERKSKKQIAAEKINMNGGEIKIISEEKFLSMLK